MEQPDEPTRSRLAREIDLSATEEKREMLRGRERELRLSFGLCFTHLCNRVSALGEGLRKTHRLGSRRVVVWLRAGVLDLFKRTTLSASFPGKSERNS